jgi:outer membrane receptor protein involved in Fe transport
MHQFLVLLAVAQDVPETVVRSPRAERTATTSAASVTVISAEELAQTGERSLPRMIAKAGGVFVQETNLGGGAPILRGLIGNQILIVVDGVRLNDSTTRGGPNQSLNGIDPATVERVEIIRGPMSVLYGSDALGGAVLIWTKSRPSARSDEPSEEARRLRAMLDTTYQSATQGWRSALGLSDATESNGWLAIGSLQSFDDLETAEGEVPFTGYDGQAWFGSWEHALSRARRVRVAASRTRDFDVPRTDRLNAGFGQTQPADAEHVFNVQDRQRYQVTYSDDEPGLSDRMEARLSFRKYLEERTIRGTGSSTRRLEKDDTETIGVGADWRKAIGDAHLVTWGFDADYDDVDATRDDVNVNTGVVTPRTGSFAPGSDYLSTGVFVQDEIFAFEPFDVTAGLRYSYFDFRFREVTTGDETDGSFDAFTGSLQVARDLAEGVRITGSIGQAYRAPNLADVARNATFAGGTELANPDLDPEQSLYEEIALDLARGAWSASIGVFHNDLSDQIGRVLVSDPTPGNPGSGDEIYQRVNAGDVEYWGAEATARVALSGGGSAWSVEGAIAYVEGEFEDTLDPTTGLPLSDVPASKVPPLNGRVALCYEPPAPLGAIAWADLTLWWADEQDELSPFDLVDPRMDPDGTDGWTRLDLDLGGPIGEAGSGATWYAGVHNLLDEAYRVHGSGLDAPGLGFVVGAHLSK